MTVLGSYTTTWSEYYLLNYLFKCNKSISFYIRDSRLLEKLGRWFGGHKNSHWLIIE